MEFDFTRFEEKFFPEWIEQFKSGESLGQYSWKKGGPTSLYGTTDMLISKYIINNLSLTEEQKDNWAGFINQFQDPEKGWYRKDYTLHYKEHTTAYAIAALYLIDRSPIHRLYEIHKDILPNRKTWEKWIEHPNWSFIWATSHVISGVPAALAMTGEGKEEFYEWCFNWLDREADPKTGFYRRGLLHKIWKSRISKHELGGAFHMYYVYEFFDRTWPYPEKIVDHTLNLQHENGLWDKDVTYCIDLDAIYCLTRSSRNAGNYRKRDVKEAIIKYLKRADQIFNNKDFFFGSYDNSHRLTGALSAIAECQKFYPDLVKTKKPWRQSLDKACFI